MKDLIAKRYIKALSNGVTEAELKEIAELLNILTNASQIVKFKELIYSPYVTQNEKIDFIINGVLDGRANIKFTNFIKILAEHKRLDLFCEVFAEISLQLATLNKEYIAQLFVNDSYSDDVLKNIESKINKKLGVNLSLRQQIVADAGIKLVVDDLGVEISFSQEKFINDLRNHILKAF